MASTKLKPGPFRIVSAVEIAALAATRWREQYSHWRDDDTFADGTTKASHDDALRRCAHTPENIERILGPCWAYPQCECCSCYRDVVIEFGQAYGDRSTLLCWRCLNSANTILSQIDGAEKLIPHRKASAPTSGDKSNGQ